MLHKSDFSSTFSQTPNKYKSNHKDALQCTASMHWTLLADSQRAVCDIPSATDTDLFPCAESFAQGRDQWLLDHEANYHCHLVNMDNMFSAAWDKHHDLCPGEFSKAVTQSFGEYAEGSTSKFCPCSVNTITQGLGAATQHADRKKENKGKIGVQKWRAEQRDNSVQLRWDD